jgi:hypothetical protein
MNFVNERIKLPDENGELKDKTVTIDHETGIFMEFVGAIWGDEHGFVGAIHLPERIIGISAVYQYEYHENKKMVFYDWNIRQVGYKFYKQDKTFDGKPIPNHQLSKEEMNDLIPIILKIIWTYGGSRNGTPEDWSTRAEVTIARSVNFPFRNEKYINPNLENYTNNYGEPK